MLIASDPQLNRILSPFGWIDFCQIVGVTEGTQTAAKCCEVHKQKICSHYSFIFCFQFSEELYQASWWKGTGVLSLLSKDSQTGGEW